MRRLASLLLIPFALAGTASALDFNPYEGPKPVVVLLQTDPWLMVIGSDTPLLAIYQDGLVVISKDWSQGNYESTRLSPVELGELLSKVASFGPFDPLAPHYDIAPGITDMPYTSVFLDFPGNHVATSVYGLMVEGQGPRAFTRLPSDEKPDVLPGTIQELHKHLTSLSFASASAWRPSYVEVMAWPYDYAPDDSIAWPAEWPGLESGSAFKRGESYSIFLPGESTAALQTLLKTRKERGAVLISGKKMAVAYRYVFPNEPVWMRAIVQTRQD